MMAVETMQDRLPSVIEAAPLAPLTPVAGYIWGLHGEGMMLELSCGHTKRYPKRIRHTRQRRARCARCPGFPKEGQR